MKIAALALLGYVALVGTFEGLIGILQPRAGETLAITTFDPDGTPHERVVSRLELDGRLYVAANHWPRAWYRRALRNPRVRITVDGETREALAVAVTEAERERLEREHGLGPVFRFLTGFPPRRFLRLDPVAPAGVGKEGDPTGSAGRPTATRAALRGGFPEHAASLRGVEAVLRAGASEGMAERVGFEPTVP